MAKVNGTHVVTDKVLFNYVHLLEPVVPMNGGEPVYSTCIIIPKSDTETLDAIKKAIENAMHDGVDRFGGKIPNVKTLRMPLRDGDVDREGREEYANCWFINTKSKYKPRVVDKQLRDIETEDEVYSGMYGRVSLNFYAYANSGNKGIACGLGDVQKLEDGTRFGGRASVADMFGAAEGSEDDNGGLPF